jgi:hypothetical protein
MSARTPAPPRWAEVLLEHLVPIRNRDIVTGDLREEYAESQLPQAGRLRANLWYLRQVLSFVPHLSWKRGPTMRILFPVSLFTLASTLWLAVMEIILRHPGFATRTTTALCMALICLATLLVRPLHLGTRAERLLWLGAVALIGVGVNAVAHLARATHFEGFVLIISVALILQGVLMLTTLGRSSDVPPPYQAT